jgi:hypothetical protein
MSRRKFPRAFLAASSVLIMLTAVSPLANAADHGKSGDHGKPASPGKSGDHEKNANKSVSDSILKAIQQSPVFNGKGKKFENDGNALQAQTKSLLKELNKLSSGNPAVTLAVNSYITTVDTATATFQSAIKAAKTTYKSALAAATTDASKQSAEAAYKAAISAAQQAFNSTIAAANLLLKTALTGLLATPSPNPSPSTTPSPSPSPSST